MLLNLLFNVSHCVLFHKTLGSHTATSQHSRITVSQPDSGSLVMTQWIILRRSFGFTICDEPTLLCRICFLHRARCERKDKEALTTRHKISSVVPKLTWSRFTDRVAVLTLVSLLGRCKPLLESMCITFLVSSLHCGVKGETDTLYAL